MEILSNLDNDDSGKNSSITFPRFTESLIKFSENKTYPSIIEAKEWEYIIYKLKN